MSLNSFELEIKDKAYTYMESEAAAIISALESLEASKAIIDVIGTTATKEARAAYATYVKAVNDVGLHNRKFLQYKAIYDHYVSRYWLEGDKIVDTYFLSPYMSIEA